MSVITIIGVQLDYARSTAHAGLTGNHVWVTRVTRVAQSKSATVSSLLPSKRRANQGRRADVNMKANEAATKPTSHLSTTTQTSHSETGLSTTQLYSRIRRLL